MWGLAGLAAISVSAIIVMGFTYIKWISTNQRLSQADKTLAETYKQLESHGDIDTSPVIGQIHVKLLSEQASLLKEQGNTQGALAIYKKAFELLKKAPKDLLSNPDIQILSVSTIESVHQELIELLNSSNTAGLTPDEVRYAELELYLKNEQWLQADRKTAQIMLYIANREKEGWLDKNSINNFSCSDLEKINSLWLNSSNGKFAFSVQKDIWIEVGGTPGKDDIPTYLQLAERVGWQQLTNRDRPPIYRGWEINTEETAPPGHYPAPPLADFLFSHRSLIFSRRAPLADFLIAPSEIARINRWILDDFLSRAANCNL